MMKASSHPDQCPTMFHLDLDQWNDEKYITLYNNEILLHDNS